jgi:CheY-like chemotaxis protein
MTVANNAGLLNPEEQSHPDEAVVRAEVPTDASSRAILVADDDPTVRGFVVLALKEEGYQVLTAENGRKALEECVRHPGVIHALITDAVMPEMNGRELAERARQIRPNLKVVLMSGYVDRGLKNEDNANPSYAFLQKPFSGEALIEAVKRLCASVGSAVGGR